MNSSLFLNIPRIPLITTPTPVHELTGVSTWLGHSRLFVKREDATDTRHYGGNKVRNLEFILADALKKGSRRVVTLAPLGSNFVAALAAQAAKVDLPVDVFHFTPAKSAQISAHARYSAHQGARLHQFDGGRYLGAAKAGTALLGSSFVSFLASFLARRDAYFIAPGGSNPLGTLRHLRAILELENQVKRGEIPEPDHIVVGVGACGTLAGIIAGLRLTQLKSRVIGIRCVDPIVCNRHRVASLANAALKILGARIRVTENEIDLRDLAGDGNLLSYGVPLLDADELIANVRLRSGIELDTTYTTKVFSFLRANLGNEEFRDRDVLYWNTYSPLATQGFALKVKRPRLLYRPEPTPFQNRSSFLAVL